jgi:exodeoxyribonuclease V gamma subunit
MLHLHFSNRFELLVAQLLQRLAATPAGPFDVDTVVVPSAAVRRALTLATADALGVSTQLSLPFLAPWLWAQMARLLPGVATQSPFAPPVLRWRVMAALADGDWLAAHPRLGGYLAGADDVMRFELASRVAALFDQYLTYRPDWLQAWQQGQAPQVGARSPQEHADAAWQAALWQRLARNTPQAELAGGTTFVDALRALQPQQATEAGLPAVLHVFALPTMPALHMDWLQHIARLVDVHVYVLNPCQEYWFELIDPRRLSHLAARGRAQDSAHQEVGHRLLAAWGQQTQALVDGLVDAMDRAASTPSTDDGLFQAQPGASLLARLQNSMLELQEPEPGAWPLEPGDRSIELHVCHSLTRELEVLHDHLLGLLARGELQHPSQVLVVTPDLEAAAPLIDAVFGTVPTERALPYTLTGRARSTVNAPARALLAVLALAGSRFQASEVFALLQQDIVARRFGLDPDALQQLHDSLLAAGARWGLDAGHRASFQLPATAAQTWADALDRLFLGYALPSQVTAPFDELLPAADTEGGDALALGALSQFISRLRVLHQAVAQPRTPAAWHHLLQGALQQFLLPQGDELDDQRELQSALAELFNTLELAGAEDEAGGASVATLLLPFAVLRAALVQQLDDPARGGVPTGAITFSSMSSLRHLPYEHVCVIGLNDGAYPSAQRPSEFDLMPLQPRRGDRQRRVDERNLFLDLLLAARRSLYLSHTGRSLRDNSPLPPSVLVSELLDLLLPAVADPAAGASGLLQARRQLVVEHPLQPFDTVAFQRDADPRLRSYNGELAAAVRSSLEQAPEPVGDVPVIAVDDDDADNVDGDDTNVSGTPTVLSGELPRFFSQPLPPPELAWRSVSVTQLDEFFRNPCRTLLRRRLGLDLGRPNDALEDEEAFLPDNRGRSALASRLLPAMLAGADEATVHALALAGQELPPGALGRQQLVQALETLHGFSDEVRRHTAQALLPPHGLQLQWTLQGDVWQLTGHLSDLHPAGLVRWRYGPVRATDRLSAWLAHLQLCASQPPGAALHTRHLSLEPPLQFQPVPAERAAAWLGELVDLYRQGLREPLHFFPRSAWAYVEGDNDLAAAQRAWRVTTHMPHGESADAAYRLALRGGSDPLDADFERLAQQVYRPLRAALADDHADNHAGTPAHPDGAP